MASIVFGAGTSHTPMLNMSVEEWPLFEELDRHRAHLHKDGRRATYEDLLAVAPASMEEEITADKLARRHGEAMAAMDRLRGGLAAAALDALVVVGDDHKEIYQDDNMPSVLVYRGETIPNMPNRTARAPGPDGPRRPAWMQRAAALSGPCRARPSFDRRADRSGIRRVVGQCAAQGRRRGPCFRLRPSTPLERRGGPRGPGRSQHVLPAQPAFAAA